MSLSIDNYMKKECIRGVIYNMSPSAGFSHADVNGNIFVQFRQKLKNSLCKVYIENADLYMDKSNTEYVIPDIMIVCDSKAFKKGTTKYYGVPKLVVETLNPSTAKKDRTLKMDFYARKGIKEYWIVEATARSIEVYYLEESGYQLEKAYILQDIEDEDDYNAKDEIALREFPHISIMLEDIFEGIDMD